jgi:hypothetical protein
VTSRTWWITSVMLFSRRRCLVIPTMRFRDKVCVGLKLRRQVTAARCDEGGRSSVGTKLYLRYLRHAESG